MGEPSFPKGRAWVELDLGNLRHNVRALQALLPPRCELMPAVKANAYGHGAVIVSKELSKLGITAFCVATVGEGMELRQHGIQGVILILGYTHPEQFDLLQRYELTQTVVDYAYAKLLNGYGQPIRAQIGIDTGMHRLGERCEEIDRICEMFRMKNLRIDGVFTHLCADDTETPEDRAFTRKQGEALEDVVRQLGIRGFARRKVHILSSYGLLNYPELGGDYARVGIALYGVLSTREDRERCKIDLRPVLSVRARVSSVKELQRGEYAGYGLAFAAKKNMKIAALAVGYADGLPRALSCGVGSVLINNCTAPIIGRICMDQTLVDISHVPDVSPGEVATVLGKDGHREITAYDLSEQAGTITNEALSRLGSRLERVIA